MNKRILHRNKRIKFVMKLAKKYNCSYQIRCTKHIHIKLKSISSNKKITITICSSPSDVNYDLILNRKIKNAFKVLNSE